MCELNKKLLQKLQDRTDQLWQIAARDARDRRVWAVAEIRHDILRLFRQLNPDDERNQNASQNPKNATRHGNVRPRQEPAGLVPGS